MRFDDLVHRLLAAPLIALAAVNVQLGAQEANTTKLDRASVDRSIAAWKAKPHEVAQMMITKYGLPTEGADQRLIWRNNGPWKLTDVVNEEIPHDFPMPRTNIVFQAINYRVGSGDHAKALFDYDGIMIERTKGELAARCDKEEANFLALNLAHDIVTGRWNIADARRFYAETIMNMMKGTTHP